MRLIIALSLCLLCISSIWAQEDRAIAEIIAITPELSIFAAALEQTEWGSTLGEDGPYTVFAPSNDAFAAAYERLELTQEQLFSNPVRLSSLISYHILPEAQSLAALQERSSVMPLRMSSLVLTIEAGKLLLNEEARIIQGDIAAANGRLHIVDTVLLAPGEFAIAEADNLAYLVFGLAVVTIIMLTYLASVVWRWRMVAREMAAINERMAERESST